MSMFEDTMTKVVREHTQMHEIVKRYDEVIANKVNKMDLIGVEKKIYERFAKKDSLKEMHEIHEVRIVKLIHDVNVVDETMKN